MGGADVFGDQMSLAEFTPPASPQIPLEAMTPLSGILGILDAGLGGVGRMVSKKKQQGLVDAKGKRINALVKALRHGQGTPPDVGLSPPPMPGDNDGPPPMPTLGGTEWQAWPGEAQSPMGGSDWLDSLQWPDVSSLKRQYQRRR
jgi:hypothetical protein